MCKTKWFVPALLLLLSVGTRPRIVESWSLSLGNSNHRTDHNNRDNGEDNDDDDAVTSSGRRRLIRQGPALSAILAATTVGSTTAAAASDAAASSCLRGDLRPACIGAEKIPHASVDPYFDTPEQFRKIWPEMVYVPPPEPPADPESAVALLRAQRDEASGAVRREVLAGRLEEAGVLVLGVIPAVAAGSDRLLRDAAERRIRGPTTTGGGGGGRGGIETVRARAAEANRCWSECDRTIGRGLRGDLGSVPAAQLVVLSSLRDAVTALDDFLAVVAVDASEPAPAEATTGGVSEGP